MRKKVKLGKLLAVIFLTVLIWVWADLRQDDTYPVEDAIITAAKSGNFWVQLNQGDSVKIDKVVFKGPLRNINTLKQKEQAGTFQAKFIYNPKEEGTLIAGEQKVNVAKFIENQDEIRNLGVSVESCTPKDVNVNIVQLEQKECSIECMDAQGRPLTQAVITPDRINMYVPPNWGGASLKATVELNATEVNQARNTSVKKEPYIELRSGADRHQRLADRKVEVKLPPEGDNMQVHQVPAVLYIALSQNLIGEYKVKVNNATELSHVNILATQAAFEAYRDSFKDRTVPQITLYVVDDVRDEQPPLSRKVEYNLPPEYVASGEIMINKELPLAEFELVRLPAADNTE